ncbi:uncharacterized protein OCT59_012454 [Rhizophagus irregularis]|uniref:uncharacterized protein n=1 Tax=Rhizophagus irregularis TaxID=588596 RepID=UPI001A0EE8DA|nr:hypothetical protein OCT59_012454 [Rhizophagus irregularis]GET64799.1 hypothetical protein GLOIN_2v1785135 [Rhizophagus irregularis DAOM 181602=DAOM 197198]
MADHGTVAGKPAPRRGKEVLRSREAEVEERSDYTTSPTMELMPITHTTEPYRSNVHVAKPYRSNVRTAELYRRELTPIIREPYSSNWTRDVNGELQLTFVFILEFWSTLTFF